VQRAGKNPQSDPQSNRTVVQAPPARRLREPAGRPRPAIPRGRRCGERSLRTLHRQGPDPRSARREQSAPRFALTLRAMTGTQNLQARSSGRSILALSVLALLALGCFPLLAHADSSGIQYSDAPPTVTGTHKIPTKPEPPAHSSKANGGASAPDASGGAGASKGSSAGDSSSKSGGASGTANDGGTGQQGSPGKGSADGSKSSASTGVGSGEPASSSSDDSSSPLVPILVAIAALAAISIGVVTYRRRRGPNTSVSPKAS
jgi:cobalamin biosynthesis Mg chelatase CobN